MTSIVNLAPLRLGERSIRVQDFHNPDNSRNPRKLSRIVVRCFVHGGEFYVTIDSEAEMMVSFVRS